MIYYNVKSKTIWAYTTSGWDDEDGVGNYILVKGEAQEHLLQVHGCDYAHHPIELEVDLNDSSDSELIDGDGHHHHCTEFLPVTVSVLHLRQRPGGGRGGRGVPGVKRQQQLHGGGRHRILIDEVWDGREIQIKIPG